MFFKKNILLFFLICSSFLSGQTSIKAMFYNTLNYDSNTESQTRTTHLKTVLNAVQPDLFMVCEMKNETASNYLFTNAVLPYNNNFSKAPFKYSQSLATGLLQMVYYNSNKLVLESTTIIPTRVRDINHYTFKINTKNANTNPIRIEVFVTHLKASIGTLNRQKRFNSVENFTRELEKLPADSYVLFAGDFNFYTSNEEGFLKLIDTANSIKIIDPINRLCPAFPNDGKDYFDTDYNATYFWNNSSFSDIHSQSTRTTPLNDGSGGGIDDRFDFIMMSKNFTTSKTLFYKTGTYKPIGNNGNCYNSYVSNPNCFGIFSQELRNALYHFSDHLPIVMEIETPENTLSIQKETPVSFLTSNIVSNTISIKINSLSKIEKIVIYNQLGQKVKQVFIKNKQHLNLDLSHFSKGIYYLKADFFKPLKFVKI